MLLGLLCSCNSIHRETKGKEYSFAVVSTKDIPEEFLRQINDQKHNPFQMSFLDENYLYVAVGYGEQNTGGYSIQVDSISEDGEKIRFVSHLIGPKEEENVRKKASYPYIVIKMEKMDRDIIYQ
jgi:hypothetical protein